MNNSWTTGSLRSSNWSSWYSYASASLTKLKPPLSSLSSCFIEPTLFIIILTSSSKILCPVVHQSVNEHRQWQLRNKGCWQKSTEIKFTSCTWIFLTEAMSCSHYKSGVDDTAGTFVDHLTLSLFIFYLKLHHPRFVAIIPLGIIVMNCIDNVVSCLWAWRLAQQIRVSNQNIFTPFHYFYSILEPHLTSTALQQLWWVGERCSSSGWVEGKLI